MPAQTRIGDLNTGHDLCPPISLAVGSPDVFINGLPAGRVGDSYNVHSCPSHLPHAGVIAAGSPTVFINGIPAGRIGDSVSCGGSVMQGSPNMFNDDKGSDWSADTYQFSEVDSGPVLAEEAQRRDDLCYQITQGILQQRLDAKEDRLKKELPNQTLVELATVAGIANAATVAAKYQEHLEKEENYIEVLRTILALPDIAAAEAERSSNASDKTGWQLLSDFFKKWVSSRAYTVNRYDELVKVAPVYILEQSYWPWFLSYSRFYTSYRELTDELAFTENAQLVLKERLQADGVWDTGGDFDFSRKPASEWIKWYYTSNRVRRGVYTDGMLAAMGAHSIRLLSAGTVHIDPETDLRTVNVKKLYAYVYDTFNFAGVESYGFWDRKQLKFDGVFDGTIEISNQNLNDFKVETGYGGDFVILSPLREVDNFSGHTVYLK